MVASFVKTFLGPCGGADDLAHFLPASRPACIARKLALRGHCLVLNGGEVAASERARRRSEQGPREIMSFDESQ